MFFVDGQMELMSMELAFTVQSIEKHKANHTTNVLMSCI